MQGLNFQVPSREQANSTRAENSRLSKSPTTNKKDSEQSCNHQVIANQQQVAVDVEAAISNRAPEKNQQRHDRQEGDYFFRSLTLSARKRTGVNMVERRTAQSNVTNNSQYPFDNIHDL